MAQHLYDSDGFARPRSAWTHDWHPYEDYQTVHYEHITALIEEGKVLRQGLSFIETRSGKRQRKLVKVNVRGRVECASGVLIFIDKWLQARPGRQGRFEVRGSSYSYHAWVRPKREFLRYDCAHGLESLHRHQLNSLNDELIREQIRLEDLPVLSDFIKEAMGLAVHLGLVR